MPMRNYGIDPHMRKGVIARELSEAVYSIKDETAERIEEYFEWSIDVRGLSMSAALSETQSLIDRLVATLRDNLTEAVQDAYSTRETRNRTGDWDYGDNLGPTSER